MGRQGTRASFWIASILLTAGPDVLGTVSLRISNSASPMLRVELKASVLGEYGARAIRAALHTETDQPPSEAAINRALARLGLQDGVRRIRRPAPPKGWYLPRVLAGHAELDCFDFRPSSSSTSRHACDR